MSHIRSSLHQSRMLSIEIQTASHDTQWTAFNVEAEQRNNANVLVNVVTLKYTRRDRRRK